MHSLTYSRHIGADWCCMWIAYKFNFCTLNTNAKFLVT